MKKIIRWDKFDNKVNESKIFYLGKLKSMLSNINDSISKDLLDLEGKDTGIDITFAEIEGDMISFSTERNILNDLPEENSNIFKDEIGITNLNYLLPIDIQDNIYNKPNRNKIKIGKFVKKMLPKLNDKQIFDFVDLLKSESLSTNFTIKLVEGENIKDWYDREKCYKRGYSSNYNAVPGTLGSSCMVNKHKTIDSIFDIYTKNPDVCKLLIMLDKNGKLVARALVWKIEELTYYKSHRDKYESNIEKENNRWYLDRVYYTDDWMTTTLQNYAFKKGWLVKATNSSTSIIYRNINKDIVNVSLIIKVKKLAYKKFPFLDTFSYYNVIDGLLSNENLVNRGFKLNDLMGGYYGIGSTTQNIVDRGRNFIRRFN